MAGTASAAQTPDFSGAWRLDDRNSDTPDALTAAMRVEARKEVASQQSAPASSSSSAAPAAGRSGGHRGGMGGGGHGRHGGNGDTASKPATDGDKDPIATATYAMPPTLKADSVLLVQQDDKTFQVRLSNGDQLTGKLDGVPRQTLNGNAMVRGHVDNGQLTVDIRYADGTELNQTWAMTADGQQMVVTGAWKVPTLQQPVTFKRTYVGLH